MLVRTAQLKTFAMLIQMLIASASVYRLNRGVRVFQIWFLLFSARISQVLYLSTCEQLRYLTSTRRLSQKSRFLSCMACNTPRMVSKL